MDNTDHKWDNRFLKLAKQVGTWSKDPNTQVGAVVIGHHGQILADGFNGFPRGVVDDGERLHNRKLKHMFVVHAEMNCIYNACHSGISLAGGVMFVSSSRGIPICSKCALGIIQVGIKRVVIESDGIPKDDQEKYWHDDWETSMMVFNEAGVTFQLLNDITS